MHSGSRLHDIDARTSVNDYDQAKVEVMLGGDSELDSLIDGLRWAADKLEKIKNNK
jgi:hypothetical protein